MILQIFTHLAAFILGGLVVFSGFVYSAWKIEQLKKKSSGKAIKNESRPMGENVVAVLNSGNDALQRTIT